MVNRVEPRIMSGFLELLPEDQFVFDWMKGTIEHSYKKYGFINMDNPVMELSEVLLAKAGGETEKQIYRFNKGDTDISLRFDLTVPLARYVAKNYANLVFPFKRYAIGKVYRGERAQKGRYREFYQCDIDIIGNESLDISYDSEIPLTIFDTFSSLGFKEITININNRKILNGFFESLGLETQKEEILRIIDKMEKIGYDNFILTLKDLVSDENLLNKILEFIAIKGSNEEVLNKLELLDVNNETFKEGVKELRQVITGISNLGLEEKYYKINLHIARGLDYYTGTVYETFLNDYPELGCVCGGGRYNDLASFYTDKKLPGVGVSIGLTRLYSKLKEIEFYKNDVRTNTKVMIISLDGAETTGLKLASMLRKKDINVDVPYLNGKGMKQKMQYASRLGVPYVVIIGEDEVKNGVYALKDMRIEKQETLTYDELLERLAQ